MTHYDRAVHPPLLCVGCNLTPGQLDYRTYRMDPDGDVRNADGSIAYVDDDDYVWQEEGTLNPMSGHFLCDDCYIKAGMPTGPGGWKVP